MAGFGLAGDRVGVFGHVGERAILDGEEDYRVGDAVGLDPLQTAALCLGGEVGQVRAVLVGAESCAGADIDPVQVVPNAKGEDHGLVRIALGTPALEHRLQRLTHATLPEVVADSSNGPVTHSHSQVETDRDERVVNADNRRGPTGTWLDLQGRWEVQAVI